MTKEMKVLWAVVAVVAVISVVAFFNGRTVTQVIENPLGVLTPYAIGPESCLNNLCTYVASGSFKNGTTTIVSFANPYLGSATSSTSAMGRATSTIDLVRLYNTGVATSTYSIKCGVSNNAGWLSSENQLLIDTQDIATSTNFGLITSGVVNPSGYTLLLNASNPNDSAYVSSAASSSVAFGPAQYFVCKVALKPAISITTGAFTGTNNTHDGNFLVRIIRGY